ITITAGGGGLAFATGADAGAAALPAVAKANAVPVVGLGGMPAPLTDVARAAVSSPATVHADSPLFDRAFAVRQTAADAGFVVVGAAHTDAGAAADWLNFDAAEVLDFATDAIDVG